MDMNININTNQQIILIIFMLAIIICLYLFNGGNITQINEGFQSNNNNTIFENSLKNTFSGNNKLRCNILPLVDVNECPDKKDLFPVHIIMLSSDKYLAVFNDGKIYTKKNLVRDKFWKGPLRNSMPNGSVPLRMITIDTQKRLLGVGFDNKIYRKSKSQNEDLEFISNWDIIPNTNDIIYILYESSNVQNTKTSPITSNDKLLAINKDGLIQTIIYDNLGSDNFEVLANDLFPVIKIYYDKNGYLLGIGEDFKLYRKATKSYNESSFDPTTKTINQVLDVLYDIDGKMYGLTFLDKLGRIELMKQNMPYFASKFLPLELSEYGISKENKISVNDIIKYKTGVDKDRDRKAIGYNTIEEVNSLLELEQISDLRKLCANRGYLSGIPYHNFEFVNELQKQKEKINDLNQVIKDLIKYDPEGAKIQESVQLLDNPNI